MTRILRVLVVDDDFRVAAVHAGALERLPWCEVVGTATTLAQARQRLTDGPVDLVLADQYLPDGSGVDLIGAADASVILVTADDALDTVRRALVRGVVGYMLKPFPMQSLVERVAAYARFRDQVEATTSPDQAAVDALLGQLRHRPSRTSVPKGRSSVTATSVSRLLRDSPDPLTAVAVADALGVSRATAQRYLSDLVAEGSVTLSLRYGTTGRPEHSYQWAG